ncbi:MAG: hypothetical protein ABIQ59_01450 [Nocardioidaceae bacterium]
MEPAQLVALVAAAAVVVAVLVAVLFVRASRRRWQAQLDAARADVEALSARLDDLAAQPAAPVPGPDALGPAPREFVITSLTAHDTELEVVAPPSTHLTAGKFASVATGESLVRVLSLGYGVRRALSAENRNRIRFEVRREVKRARRQRRRDLKEAKRHLRHVTTESEGDAA